MSIIRFLITPIAVFLGGAVSFFLLLIAGAALLCLLAVGAACAMLILWAVLLYGVYLYGHDPQIGHQALLAILMASGCFGFQVLMFSGVMKLWNYATRPRHAALALELG